MEDRGPEHRGGHFPKSEKRQEFKDRPFCKLMQSKLLIVVSGTLLLLVTGCATQKYERVPTNYFLFTQDAKSGLWRPRYDDFVEIAKAYAKQKGISFSFEGTEALLWVLQKDGALIAQVEFCGSFGSPYLAVEIDTAGKAIRHDTGVLTEGHLP